MAHAINHTCDPGFELPVRTHGDHQRSGRGEGGEWYEKITKQKVLNGFFWYYLPIDTTMGIKNPLFFPDESCFTLSVSRRPRRKKNCRGAERGPASS